MSDSEVRSHTRGSVTRSRRGQSLVEFALVLPMLLVLLLGVADFGRVFAAGITLEAAARNAAEAAAQEYVQLVRNRPGGTLDAADYARLHTVAMDTVCAEAETLPNKVSCSMPAAAVCIHDQSGDPGGCGSEAAGSALECDALNGSPAWDPSNEGPQPGGDPALTYVEVRVCYRFTTLFNLTDLRLPLGWGLSLGDIYLERSREFVAACYPSASGPCN